MAPRLLLILVRHLTIALEAIERDLAIEEARLDAVIGPNVTDDKALPPAAALITIKEAAAYLRISVGTLYELMNRGEIATVRIGRARRIRTADLIEWINHS